jgi:hypothetical protein
MGMPIWQLSTGQADYPWLQSLIAKYKNGGCNILKYAKGSANMKVLPNVGDTVHVSCRAKLLVKGTLIETFKEEYNPHIGQTELYATILINEVPDNPPYLRGQRRNWTKIQP